MKHLLILCLFVPSIVLADHPCSLKAKQSVPGQYVHQLFKELSLSAEQSMAILDIQDTFFTEFEEAFLQIHRERLSMAAMRVEFAEDGVLSEEENRILQEKKNTIRNSQQDQKNRLQLAASQVRTLLSDEQQTILYRYHPNLTFPAQSLDSARNLVGGLMDALAAYSVLGYLPEPNRESVVLSIETFLDTIYTPDWMEGALTDWFVFFDTHRPFQRSPLRPSRAAAIRLSFATSQLQTFIQDDQLQSVWNQLQNRPLYTWLVQDRLIDMALVCPLAKCYLESKQMQTQPSP